MKKFKLTVYYMGPDAGDAAALDFHHVRIKPTALDVQVEVMLEELLSPGQEG